MKGERIRGNRAQESPPPSPILPLIVPQLILLLSYLFVTGLVQTVTYKHALVIN